MIRPFRDADAEKLFNNEFSKKYQAVERAARRKLEALHAARSLRDLALPGNQVEALTRDRKGQHSVRVNERLRICFVWRDGDAFEVEIVDYH